MQIWTRIGLGALGSEDICSIASQISWRWLPVSEVHVRKAGEKRCWQHPIPCQGSDVQPWWVWKDKIWSPFGCGEVTLTAETACFTTPSLKEPGRVIAGAWRGLAGFWTARSRCRYNLLLLFQMACMTVENCLGPFPTWRRDLSWCV